MRGTGTKKDQETEQSPAMPPQKSKPCHFLAITQTVNQLRISGLSKKG